MAEWNEKSVRVGSAPAYAVDAGLRAYMLQVYNYMALGVALTGFAALLTANLATTSEPNAFRVATDLYLTPLGQALYTSPLQWVVMLAPLAFVFFLGFKVRTMSVSAAQIAFWSFAAIMGISISSILLVYTGASVARVFFISAAAFGALSLWGYTTKKDLSGWGSFLFIGVIGLILASLVNLFWPAPGLSFAISIIGVLIFAGLTAYDTQRIKEMYDPAMDGSVAAKTAIMGALALYLDFINMFLFLLRLMGSNRE